MTTASVILAAGLGKRMRSNLPKTLHPLLGKPIVFHALDAVLPYVDLAPVLMTGFGGEQVAFGNLVGVARDGHFAGGTRLVRERRGEGSGLFDAAVDEGEIVLLDGEAPELRAEVRVGGGGLGGEH